MVRSIEVLRPDRRDGPSGPAANPRVEVQLEVEVEVEGRAAGSAAAWGGAPAPSRSVDLAGRDA